jgi:hypothetical protein
METETVKTEIKYFAKNNCKQCYGRGVIIRTLPRGRKLQVAQKSRCKCVKMVRKPRQEDGGAPIVKQEQEN